MYDLLNPLDFQMTGRKKKEWTHSSSRLVKSSYRLAAFRIGANRQGAQASVRSKYLRQ